MKVILKFTALLFLFFVSQVSAQGYPNRSIKIIVGFPPGQSVDVVARLIGPPMSQSLGQGVVVDNRPGAGGAIGVSALLSAPADGYTAMIASSGPMSINPHLSKVAFDPKTSFSPITMLASLQYVLVTQPTFPVNNLREMIALVKANPDKYNFAGSGNGTTQHLAGELLKMQAGLDIKFIPYAGSTAALTDLMAGRITYAFETIATVLPLIQAGKLKAIAVSSLKRSSQLPEVPTVAEAANLPDFNVVAWIGLVARAGTPPEITNRLSAEALKALQSPELRERYQTLGMEPVSSSPSELQRIMNEAYDRFGDAIKRANIKID
ncbi:MAG: tripartite tricarboxylate transporter substrate binding protein [Ilumatobacteraceae bacterium]|jgi:tripartite-type tricarboxylate transporter receptor subunit TctC|nr:tripartite tricarboxylate transporter substrate binding protein [Ilumatobacteraceae bacterium]